MAVASDHLPGTLHSNNWQSPEGQGLDESPDPQRINPPTQGLPPVLEKDKDPISLPDPNNVSYSAEYDPATGMVTVYRKIGDRKSTRLNSSHVRISYAVFCLKKKTNT